MPAHELPDDLAAEAVNVEFPESGLGRKRGGLDLVNETKSALTSTDEVVSLATHVPGAAMTAAELWVFGHDGGTAQIGRYSGTTSSAITPSPADTFTFTLGTANSARCASLNGKLFVGANSDQNRLHCWDGTTFRRVGLIQPAAPTVANTGAGAYAATIRYYKVAYTTLSGSTVLRRSELSASVSFTPSGGGTAARVTKPAAISEGETNWELYGSADNGEFYFIATTVVGTTTYDDSAAPSTYSAGSAAPIIGVNIPPPSAKYVVSDGNRIVMAGAHESSASTGQTVPKNNRVWFSRKVGTGTGDVGFLGEGDDESIPNTVDPEIGKFWVDLGEADGTGEITGLHAAAGGIVYVFTYREVWALLPTNDINQPYRELKLTSAFGCVRHETIAPGVDAVGNPAVYFLSAEGPCRIVGGKVEYVGGDVRDLVDDAITNDTMAVTAHAVYHEAKSQYRLCLPLSHTSADEVLVLDVRNAVYDPEQRRVRGGWSRHTRPAFPVGCSVMFSRAITATKSFDQAPYEGVQGNVTRADSTSATTDYSVTPFQAYVRSPIFQPTGLSMRFMTGVAYLLARVSSGVSILCSVLGNFEAAAAKTESVTLTAATGNAQPLSSASAGSETHVLARYSVIDFSELNAVQYQLGDSSASAATWTLDAFEQTWKVTT